MLFRSVSQSRYYAADLLENQNWELSNSYFPKITNSNQYDVDKDVIDGVGLHLAIVPKGRYDTQVVMNNSQPNKKTMLDKIKQLKDTFLKSVDSIINNDNSMETKQENLEINNSSETIDNPCGSKKYENQYFTLENGEQLGIDQVIDTLTEYENAEAEKKKKEEEMNNAKATLEAEYEVNGKKMTGKEMIDKFKEIKGFKNTQEKEHDQLMNEKKEEEKEIKEEEKKEGKKEKEIKDNKLEIEIEKKDEEKEEKTMENKTKNNAEPSNTEMQKLNYAKEPNPLEKVINNSLTKEEKSDDTNDVIIMNPFKL